MLKRIIKRDGSEEEFIASKLNKWSQWAAEDLNERVDWSGIVTEAVKSLGESTTSEKLQLKLIELCVKKSDWPHNKMAGKLYAALLQKKLYPNGIPTVQELHKKLIKKGLMVDLDYSKEDYEYIQNNIINHNNDFNLAQFQIKFINGKYSLINRSSKKSYETPQFTYIRMAMALSQSIKVNRLEQVKSYYDSFSENALNAPTPNYVNLGTPHKGYASCCLFKSDDTIDSLAIGDYIAYKMTAQSAGLGSIINTRSIGDKVRGGSIEHQGKYLYTKSRAAAAKANQQAGRGGADTEHYSAYDPEAFMFARLQNPRTPVDKRNRDIHFSMIGNIFLCKKIALDEEIFTFTSYSAPDLWEAMFSKDSSLFESLYLKYESDDKFKKNYVNARKFIAEAIQQSYEVGTHYLLNATEMNRHTPIIEKIYTSNLCVAPETKILTDLGYIEIHKLKDEIVNVWNGEEFSEVTVRKTSDSEELISIITDSGQTIDTTLYHKFYVRSNNYSDHKEYEVRACDLNVGDRLVKFNLPIIEGSVELDKSYINGFYSGDGCDTGNGQRIYLYGQKRKLKDLFGNPKWIIQEKYDREYCHFKDLQEKFFVPDASYRIKDRLDWLAGLADADGCIYRNNGNQQLVLSSVNYEFLTSISLMLHTLGIHSKIKLLYPAGLRSLPANDDTNLNKEFNCKDSHRLIITSNCLQNLLNLGFKTHRLQIVSHNPQRDARWFIKVAEIKVTGRKSETYCFEEPKRHRGMFNGILTGQCQEISLHTEAYQNMNDLLSEKDNGYVVLKDADGHHTYPYSESVYSKANKKTFYGNLTNDNINDYGFDEVIHKVPTSEVALCSLAAVVLPNIKDDNHYRKIVRNALLMIDWCIHNSNYPLAHVGWTAKNRLNAGIGMVGLATILAQKGLKYDSIEGRNEIHKIAERHAYICIEQSLQLGIELGNAPWMHKTLWPDGWLPIDTYKKEVDSLVTVGLQYDWEDLRSRIIANGGIRNSTLVAHMPTESSSKAVGQPNGVYPIRFLNLKKSDQSNIIDWVAPDSDQLEDSYQMAWDISIEDQIKFYAVIQKFTDQSISADFYKDRTGNNLQLKTSDFIRDYLTMFKYGMKSRYYMNSLVDVNAEERKATQKEEVCTSGTCDV